MPSRIALNRMKTLTVEEAMNGLGHWVELALAGEKIHIRRGSATVELRPTMTPVAVSREQESSREALRLLQTEARLSGADAASYLSELSEERLAAEERLHR
jgi:hypothetical protein